MNTRSTLFCLARRNISCVLVRIISSLIFGYCLFNELKLFQKIKWQSESAMAIRIVTPASLVSSAAFFISSDTAIILWARLRISLPFGVSLMLWFIRSKRAVLSSFSSSFIWNDTADCVYPSFSAALVKLLCSAT